MSRYIYISEDYYGSEGVIKFCILIDNNTDYVLIYFYNFLKLETLIFNFFKIEIALMPESPKYFPPRN
jgi:hypothetical protein